MTIFLDIQRFNPESDSAPRVKRYRVEAEPQDRLLDALMEFKRIQDGSLGFRKSCAHGVCGSDAMRVNGKERLACKTLIQDLVTREEEAVITIQPLKHLPVERDLMVDQTIFLDKFRQVTPYLLPNQEADAREVQQSPEERALFDDATKCINCGACYSACPVLDENPHFLGPAALVQAARFVDDSRDRGLQPRLAVLDQANGVWSCENHFQCTRVCPRGIKITKLINLMKRKIKQQRGQAGESGHPGGKSGASGSREL